MATPNAFDLVNQILQDAKASEKQASLSKSATDPSDSTSHPVMKADDGTQPAREGSRSAENEADVRKALGNQGITGQSDANKADGSKATDTIGTVKQESDELKGNAKEPKSDKDLPPESKGHPSNVTGKYASLHTKGASLLTAFASLGKEASSKKDEAGNPKPDTTPLKPKDASQPAAPGKVIEPNGTKTAADATVTKEAELQKEAEVKLACARKYEDDAVAGYMAAQLLTEALGMNKQAEAREVAYQNAVSNIVKTAHEDAQLVAEYLAGIETGSKVASTHRTKFANEALAEDASAGAGEGGGGGGGEIPPEAMAAMGGAGGGPPPGAEGAGGPPPGAEGGGGGEVDPAVVELVQALEAEGITPEMLEAALAQEDGGAGGGMAIPPEAGGEAPPPEMAAAGGGGEMPPPGVDKASALKQRRKLVAALNQLNS